LRASDQRDHVTARALFERACELNHPLGCKWLSLDLDHTRDPRAPADKDRGQVVMIKACELGELDSCRMVANSYLYGNRPGVPEDHQRAVQLLQKTCDAGDGASCDELATCYADGTGVPKDRALARKLRRRGAELGFVGE
jgi:TPR repeat protein